MMIAVSDLDGSLLALYRMPDATVFSIDVAVAKARNVVYFSSLPGLPGAYADSLPGSTDLPGIPPGTAVTNRTIGFGAQPLFPPGIDNSEAGPFFNLYVNDTANACTQGTQPPNPNQNGIVFFPGSAPLYRGGKLVGGLGVSGDGVDQDDFVTAAGTALQTLTDPSDSGHGFEAPNGNSRRPDRDRQRPAALHKVPAQSHAVISEMQQDHLRHSSRRASHLLNRQMALGKLFLSPIVILMAFGAASVGRIVFRASFFMTSAAGGDARQQDIRGLTTLRAARMAAGTGQHAMRIVLEVGMLQPSLRNR